MRVRIPGVPKAQCDRCGFVVPVYALKRDGQSRGGFLVCNSCYDPLHPQEFVTGKPESPPPPNTRHVTTTAEAVFLTPGEVTEASL
jgi:hypothetical protein